MKRQNEQGSALLLTIIITVILLFLGGSLGILAMVESRMTQREEASMQAYYLARSGADAIAQYIINNPEKYGNIQEEQSSEPVSFNGSDEEYFTVEVIPSGGKLRIESTGFVGGQRRAVHLTLEIGLLGYFTHAVVGLGDTLDLDGIKVKNLVGTVAAYPGTGVTLPDSRDVVRIPTGSFPEIVFPSDQKPARPNNPPSETNLTINDIPEDVDEYIKYYDTLSGNLTIDLDDKTVILGVRELAVSSIQLNHGPQKKGRLLLFVEQKFMNNDYSLNWDEESMPDPRDLTIYYSGDEFTMQNKGQKINGNVVVEKGTVALTGGEIGGNFFTLGTSVTIQGNPLQTSLIYAPNATVEIKGTAQVGSLIAEGFVGGGNAKLIFPFDEGSDTGYIDTFPHGIFGEDYDYSTEEGSYKRGTWSKG